MKNIFFLLSMSILLLFSSCSSGNNNDTQTLDLSMENLPQDWQLFKMTRNGTEVTGAEMEWQEQYTLKPDGTFIKTRTMDGEVHSVSGTFTIVEEGEEQGYKLKYENAHSIIGGCQPLQEYLYFDRNSEYLLSNWWACDGPGLFYRK